VEGIRRHDRVGCTNRQNTGGQVIFSKDRKRVSRENRFADSKKEVAAVLVGGGVCLCFVSGKEKSKNRKRGKKEKKKSDKKRKKTATATKCIRRKIGKRAQRNYDEGKKAFYSQRKGGVPIGQKQNPAAERTREKVKAERWEGKQHRGGHEKKRNTGARVQARESGAGG